MLTPILWFLSPVGRYVGIALVIASIVGGFYLKGRYDDHIAYTKRLQREASQAISKAHAARNSATQRFDAGKLRNDGFARD